MKPTVTIFLTPIDVEQFKAFQQHYELFKKLQDTDALKIGFGKVVLNYAFGELQTITKEEVVYKR